MTADEARKRAVERVLAGDLTGVRGIVNITVNQYLTGYGERYAKKLREMEKPIRFSPVAGQLRKVADRIREAADMIEFSRGGRG